MRSDGNQRKPSQYLLLASRGSSRHVAFMTLANGRIVNSQDLFPRTFDPAFSAPNGGVNQVTVVAQGLLFTVYTNGVKIGQILGGKPTSRPLVPTLLDLPEGVSIPLVPAELQATLDAHQTEINLAEAAFQAQRRAFEQYNMRFDKGFIAMPAMSGSGQTWCLFHNTWLWLIEA